MAFKGLRFAVGEMRNASAGTVMKVVMVAISVIPLLYGGLYLTAFLDPYENLDTVPVAIVNEDTGAEINGEWRVVGDDVAEKLADNHDGLGWNFVSADEAQSGLESGKYYMTCTIPANFTETIASADSDAPEKAALVIDYNQTQNMLASQIGGTVWKEVRTQVSDSVAEEYWNTVFNRLNDGGEQIQTAADGAGELADGLTDAREGSNTITTNLGTLADGSESLVVGLQQLVTGALQLKDGTGTLASGADSLKSGAGTLASGATSLASGANTLEQKTRALPDESTVAKAKSGSKQISQGISGLQSAGGKLANGSSSLVGGIKQLNSGLATAKGGTDQLSTSLSSASTALSQAYGVLSNSSATDAQKAQALGTIQYISNSLSTASTSASQISTGLNNAVKTTGTGGELLAGAQALQAGIGSTSDTSKSTLNGGLNQLSAGYSSFSSQVLPLVEGSPELRKGIMQLSGGAGKVSSGASQVSSGASKLANGATQLDDGAAQIANGTATAKDGSAQIADGATQLRDGSQKLTDGLVTAEDGAGELADGLSDGASELHVNGADAKAEVMSAPVELNEEYFTTVKNYGTGFAPYFISLGLWVGALMAGFVLKPLNRRLVLSGGNPAMVAFSSFMPLALMSVVQAVLLLVVLQFGLDLQIENVPGYYAFGILTALAFAAFMQFLMVAFGFPGKFIAIILLMLQLTSAAGTFPIEQTPAFFQAMNPFMPMTYVVAGMRQIMTGVDYGTVALCVTVLAGIAVVSFGLTALVARAKRTVLMEDLHPLLQLS